MRTVVVILIGTLGAGLDFEFEIDDQRTNDDFPDYIPIRSRTKGKAPLKGGYFVMIGG